MLKYERELKRERELGVGRWEEEEGYRHLFHDCVFRISPVPSAFGKKGPSSCKNPAPTDEHPGPAHSDTAAYNQTTLIIIITDPRIHSSSHQKKNQKEKRILHLEQKTLHRSKFCGAVPELEKSFAFVLQKQIYSCEAIVQYKTKH